MKYSLITVEGNIGAGKTTLAKLLAAYFNAHLILEQFENNPFLPKFYEQPEQYAFQLELSFLAARYQQLKKQMTNRDIFRNGIIADYLFIKSKLFARVNLPPDEYELYESLFEIIYPNLPQPEVLIYLHAPIGKLKANIAKRNRSYEQTIESDYLEKIQGAYESYLKSQECITLMIDVAEVDFLEHPTHFCQLIKFLNQDYKKGQHYLRFEN